MTGFETGNKKPERHGYKTITFGFIYPDVPLNGLAAHLDGELIAGERDRQRQSLTSTR
jgi:hypothetical protein